MQLYNLKHPEERVTFVQALKQGLGRDRGLFFPTMIPELAEVDQLLVMPFVERSQRLLGAWLADELGQNVVDAMVTQAFNF
ncbi:MAG TPA: threonine synthase, partial [Candidatus Rifleibacterium sp.]|nr:threonine synthase [Candidatus Rifleibacterium sp.]